MPKGKQFMNYFSNYRYTIRKMSTENGEKKMSNYKIFWSTIEKMNFVDKN